MNHTSTAGNCNRDTQISFSIGGFSSDPINPAVNSPKKLIHHAADDYTENLYSSQGFQTNWTFSIDDACVAPNTMISLPINESFGTWTRTASATLGWDFPSAVNGSDFNDSSLLFVDHIFRYDTDSPHINVPAPTFSASNSPFAFGTALIYAPQAWAAGSSTSGAGIQVGTGTLTQYRDHGTGLN